MKPKKVVVFDLETVPDERLYESADFPPLPFHRIVAIGILEADVRTEKGREEFSLRAIRAGGESSYSEGELIAGFLGFVEKRKPQLVTYNGRGFDLPVLQYRAMAHKIPAPVFYSLDYDRRYDQDGHCDLMDVLSWFGAATRAKLDHVCIALGIPGKIEVDGSQVHQLFKQKQIQKIRDYCELDVISTYLIFLRYRHHRGVLADESYNAAVRDLREYLELNSPGRTHFKRFLGRWKEASKGLYSEIQKVSSRSIEVD